MVYANSWPNSASSGRVDLRYVSVTFPCQILASSVCRGLTCIYVYVAIPVLSNSCTLRIGFQIKAFPLFNPYCANELFLLL